MRRRETDLMALLAGLVFLAIGAAAVASVAGDRALDPRWVVPILLIGLGVAGVVASIARR